VFYENNSYAKLDPGFPGGGAFQRNKEGGKLGQAKVALFQQGLWKGLSSENVPKSDRM